VFLCNDVAEFATISFVDIDVAVIATEDRDRKPLAIAGGARAQAPQIAFPIEEHGRHV
jgi:hypothetical protein